MANFGPTPSVTAPQPLYARYVHGSKTIDFIPAAGTDYGAGVGAGVPFGGVVVIGALVGIALIPIPAGVQGALEIEGTFSFPKANGDAGLTSGAIAYWDNSGHVATSTASGNTYLGKVEPPGTVSADLVVRVSVDAIANASGTVGFGAAPSQSVASAGTNYATGGVLNPGVNVVTGLDSTKGVALPATPAAGTIVIVIPTTSAQTCPVYPDGAATVNAISSHGAITLAALKPAIFVATSATQWYTIPLLPS